MHEIIKYINHRNEIVEFGNRDLFIIDTNLRDYSWSYDTDFNRISNFRKEVQKKKLKVSIYGLTEEDASIRKNNIFEIFEKDVLSNIQGKLWIGDYCFNCYIVEGSISEYYKQGNYLAKEIIIVSDAPFWVKETTYNFYIQDVVGKSSYPYGYPFGYSNNLITQDVTNNNFTDSNFELIIYGSVLNPTVFIKGHPYTVNTEILEGEYLTISSKDKTVIKTKINGEKVNEFNKRNKAYSVFKLVDRGQNTVSWNEAFNFDLILLEERSEPKWT